MNAAPCLIPVSMVTSEPVEKLSEARYRAGAVPLRTWLDAQERRRSVESSLTDARLSRILAEATLYRAMGGEPEAATPTSTRSPRHEKIHN